MNVWLKKKWLKNLIFTGVCATLSNCSVSPQASQLQQPNKVTQSKPAIENSSVKLVSATVSKSEEDSFPSSTEILLLVITPEEIQLREQQLELTEEWVRFSRLYFQAGTGTQEEVIEAAYFHWHKKIELLQAKNLLQLKKQESTLSPQPARLEEAKLPDSHASLSEVSQSKPTIENLSVKLVSATLSKSEEDSFPTSTSTQFIPLVITPEEIQLREQQLQAAKQTVKDAELIEGAGLGRRSEVIRANIFRFDSEIELLQAKRLLQLKQQREL
jgi:hypothetical protein